MAMNMRISSLIPAGLVVESITETEADRSSGAGGGSREALPAVRNWLKTHS